MTRDSSKFNQEHIVSGDFFQICENKNQQAMLDIQKILNNV